MIMQHTDSPAAMQIASERGKLAFGQDSEMIKFGPKTQLTSIMDNWAPYYIERVKAELDGTWKSEDFWGGLKSKMVVMAPYTNMPDDVKKLAMDTEAAIVDGKLQPFKCPVVGQDGKEVECKGGDPSRRRSDARHELLRQGHRRQDPRKVTLRLSSPLPARAGEGVHRHLTLPASSSPAALWRRIRSATSRPGIAPSMTAHLPATITRSARCAPHSTKAAKGSPWPEKRNSSSLNSARSAALPTAISPSSGRPTQAAEPLVAQRSASLWLTLVDAIARPLQQERRAHLLHQVGFVVRGASRRRRDRCRCRPPPSRRPDSSQRQGFDCYRRSG